LGVYWIGHHMQLHYVGRADRPLLWITVVFLLTVGLVPFATALLSEYPAQQLAIVVYGANLALIGVVLELHWRYVTGSARLVKADMPLAVRRMAIRRTRMGPVVYTLGIAMSFLNTPLALTLYALVPLLYLLPGSIDAHWRA